MAMGKAVKDGKGIITNYHKIAKFIVDTENELVQVLVRHYADKEYRDTEKENKKLNTDFKDKYEKLNKLVDENLPETIQERIELTNYINEIQDVRDNEPSMVVGDSNEILTYDSSTNYSLKGVYNELKKLEKYKNSKEL